MSFPNIEVSVSVAISEHGASDCIIAGSNYVKDQTKYKDWLTVKKTDNILWSIKTVKVLIPLPITYEDMTGNKE